MNLKSFKNIIFSYKNLFGLTSLIGLLVFFDQAVKTLVSKFASEGLQSFLGFSLVKIYNQNLVFGIELKQIELILQQNIFNVTFSFFIFFYFLILLYLKNRQMLFQIGITLLSSGALSNLYDKLSQGQVLDFIQFKIGNFALFFNLADIFQSLGWCIILYVLLRSRKLIWRKLERRKYQFLEVFGRDQKEFIIYMLIVLFSIGVYFSLFLPYYFASLGLASQSQNFETLYQFKFYFLFMYLVFCSIVLAVTVYISIKIYGPVYAFYKKVRALINDNDDSEFILRDGDHFKELLGLYKEIKKHIKK